jgi:hypothetical protein
MTSSGLEPTTFRLVAYSLNHLRYCVSPMQSGQPSNLISYSDHLRPYISTWSHHVLSNERERWLWTWVKVTEKDYNLFYSTVPQFARRDWGNRVKPQTKLNLCTSTVLFRCFRTLLITGVSWSCRKAAYFGEMYDHPHKDQANRPWIYGSLKATENKSVKAIHDLEKERVLWYTHTHAHAHTHIHIYFWYRAINT